MIFVWWSDINFLFIQKNSRQRRGREYFANVYGDFFHIFLSSAAGAGILHRCLESSLAGLTLQTLASSRRSVGTWGIPGIFMASLNFRNVSKHLEIMIRGDTNMSIRHKRIFRSCSGFYHQLEAWLSSHEALIGWLARPGEVVTIIKSDRITMKSESSSIYHHPQVIYHNITDSHILPPPPENHSSSDNQTGKPRRRNPQTQERNIHNKCSGY